MKRRALLGSLALLAGGAKPALPAPKELRSAELELSELTLPGGPAFGRLLLAVPRALPPDPGLLVLLHGLGETYDSHVGARAFAERYGLLSAVSRLSQPPLARTPGMPDYFGAGRLEEINARLAARPFRCPVLACPFTPNPYRAGGDQLVAHFADFVVDQLKPEVERRVERSFPAARSMLAGVSLGGYLAIEIFLRRPQSFVGLGSVQGAFGPGQATRYAIGVAKVAARVGARRIEILTTSFDPYRRPNELFQRALSSRGQAARLRVSPGPHDQRWLNEAGCIELLLAADDVFAEAS